MLGWLMNLGFAAGTSTLVVRVRGRLRQTATITGRIR